MHGAADDIAGVGRHDGANLVILQQFDGAFGAAMGAGNEDDVVAVRLGGLDVIDPVGNAAMERRRPAADIDTSCEPVRLSDRKFLDNEASRTRRSKIVLRRSDRLRRRRRLGRAFDALHGIGVRRRNLLPRALDVVFAHRSAQTTRPAASRVRRN